MSRQNLINQWVKDEKVKFEGWNFSYISKRVKKDSPPWNYKKLARKQVKKSLSLLDIDTGGGEVLLSISNLPNKSFAVENYSPNVLIARRNLKKAGVKVIRANSAHKLPFKDRTFDLILNRHGAINAKEIYRVLKQGGIFLTQQVDAKVNLIDLIKEFKAKPKWTFNNLAYRKKELIKLNFKIIKSNEWKGKIIFKDIGAVVFMLKNIPWLVDNFSVKTHLEYLKRLQRKFEKKGRLIYTVGNFLILARKT